MAINEKEYNGYLFDKLAIIERIEDIANSGDIQQVLAQCEKERRLVERKLYQQPPLERQG